MFEPIKISIPAEKFTEDVYIILEKKKVKSSKTDICPEEDAYYASKALKETYTVIMPTQEQQKTVTCYGTDGEVVTPFEGLYFRTIEEVTEKLDELNNRKAQAVFLALLTYGTDYHYRHYRHYKREVGIDLLPKITKDNFYHYISQLISSDDKERALKMIQNYKS